MHYVDAKSLLTRWNGMNLYRGCAHGCIYCDSRSVCYQFSHPFEDIEVKQNAPQLLEEILKRRRKKIVISTGSMSDPYQPCERELKLTRQCLELIDRYGFGASVITKSDLVLRDIGLFDSIHRKARSVLQMTLTIADDSLSRRVEPNVCTTSRRYEVLKAFQARGIPTVVWMTPILPFLTDREENLRQILDLCFDAGVAGIVCFNAGMTLREGSREYYYRALDRLFPGLSDRYRRSYGNAYELNSPDNDRLMGIFHSECERRGVLHSPEDCFRFIADIPERQEQLSLFGP
ncbi:MAG: radical SAM protein [Oscillospiraceae bacterium]|nr:radical SAM protein [Oscillospiraceae bacterium]